LSAPDGARLARHPIVEATDSSTVCMRSVAAALRGQFIQPQALGPWLEHAAALLSHAGPGFNAWAVNRVLSLGGTPREAAQHISSAVLARHAVDIYAGLEGPYPAVLVGAPNGGVAHLATALQVPFLSQHFLTSFRHRKHPDDIAAYAQVGTELARSVLDRCPDLAIINHYDPLHDRFQVRWVNHIRYKLLDLPPIYRETIRHWLVPGGTIVFTECRYPWKQYQVAERHTFQLGGLGQLHDEEYQKDQPAIRARQLRDGSPFVGPWQLPLPQEIQPESEWGSLPELRTACERFAAENGYGFRCLSLEGPEDWSRLAFRAHLTLHRKAGRTAQGTMIDCFTQVNPVAGRLSSLLPLWLPFNCRDSLSFLSTVVPELPKGKPVLFSPVPNFADAFDTATLDEWAYALRGFDVRFLGITPQHYPSDLRALVAAAPELQRWCASHPARLDVSMCLEELATE
jgi:hypothetical protein